MAIVLSEHEMSVILLSIQTNKSIQQTNDLVARSLLIKIEKYDKKKYGR